jgi:hypothetical protein
VVNDATSEDLIDVIRVERCRVLKRISKASRIPAAEKMSAVLERIIANPDEPTLWSDLLRLTHACLAVPGRRGGKRHLSSLTSQVNNAFDAYPSAMRQSKLTKQSNGRRSIASVDKRAARISEKLEESDVRGAIRLVVSEDILAPHDEKILAVLRLKYPSRRSVSIDASSTPELQKNSAPPPLVLLVYDVTDAIKSFPAGSAGECDGLRAQHLKDMTSPLTSDTGKTLVSHLREFASLCLAGKVPSSIQPVFCAWGVAMCSD